jgi:hypothetical protein
MMKDTAALTEKMHIRARQLVARHEANGLKIDKKQCRYNDIVNAAMRYGACAQPFSETAAWRGLRDAVSACVIGDPMHVSGGKVADLVPDWMIAA